MKVPLPLYCDLAQKLQRDAIGQRRAGEAYHASCHLREELDFFP